MIPSKLKLGFLAGKKTHIVALALVLTALGNALSADGTIDLSTMLSEAWANKDTILLGLGLSSLRAGVAKIKNGGENA